MDYATDTIQDTEKKDFQKRLTAYKIDIFTILNNSLVKDDLSAGYINLNNNKISRVNVIATIIHKPDQELNKSVIIDDGSGRITLRAFGNDGIFSNIEVGDLVLVIGKIRQFDNENYIFPEIIKKLTNPIWVEVRKLEFKKGVAGICLTENKEVKGADTTKVITDIPNLDEEICSYIKKLDYGDGVAFDNVIKNFNYLDEKKIEEIIYKLISIGEIFELRSGILKVL